MTELLEHHHHRRKHPSHKELLTWHQLRRSVKHRWMLPFLFVDWLAQWAHHGLSKLSILELLETCSSFTLLIGLIFYFAEAPERTKARHYQAWQVINTAQGKGGNGGRIDALRELAEDEVSLVGVDVSDSYLQGVNLEHADLRRSDFHGADLKSADLSMARLEQAAFGSANLRSTKLAECDLTDANFTDADLSTADLNGANIHGVKFNRADLRGAGLANLRDWQSARYTLANVHGVRSAPDGFIVWALAHGAVDLASDADWEAAQSQSPSAQRAAPN